MTHAFATHIVNEIETRVNGRFKLSNVTAEVRANDGEDDYDISVTPNSSSLHRVPELAKMCDYYELSCFVTCEGNKPHMIIF